MVSFDYRALCRWVPRFRGNAARGSGLAAGALLTVLLQLASAAVVPLALCCQSSPEASASAADEVLCNCGHGPGATCPMHQRTPKPQTTSSPDRMRWCDGCPGQDESALVALVQLLALPLDRVAPAETPAAPQVRALVDITRKSLGPTPPDSPPPRA